MREKLWLVKLIVKTRKDKDLSQAALAKKLGISQARVAQIESGVGTTKVTFDVLFNMLVALRLDYKCGGEEGGVRGNATKVTLQVLLFCF